MNFKLTYRWVDNKVNEKKNLSNLFSFWNWSTTFFHLSRISNLFFSNFLLYFSMCETELCYRHNNFIIKYRYQVIIGFCMNLPIYLLLATCCLNLDIKLLYWWLFLLEKKRGESKADKTRSCVRPYVEIWVHESAKTNNSTRHLLVVSCYLVPFVYQET